MPIDTDVQSRIDLLVGIDKVRYGQTKKALEGLFNKDLEVEIDLPDGMLKGLADKFREASQLGGKGIAEAFGVRFDSEMKVLLESFADIRQELMAAEKAGDASEYRILMDKQALLEAQIDAATDEHKNRIEAAKKLRESLQFKNLKEAGGDLSDGFFDNLNKAKSGDLEGLTRALLGGLSKGASKIGEAAAGTGAAKAGSALEGVAVGLGAAAAGLAVVAGVVGGLIALFAVLDDAAKDLNKTMLEGASQADFAVQAQGSLLTSMEDSMDAARSASLEMAEDFRGTGEEMSGILAQLNTAGFSYREIAGDIKGAGDEQRAYTEAIKTTFIWSKALGLSTSEVADVSAEWSTDFGQDLTQIGENFATISKFAMQGGFNVKRFFTSVSQATSGMAIYNARMEEAAYLLSKTQKILGGTDASDFIKSLTQGFTDESMTDRIKRIMIAGQGDTNRIFEDTANRTAKGFAESFGSSKTRKNLEEAFASVNKKFDIGDPVALQKTWGDMDAKSRRLVVAELRANGDEQAQAAARQLETLGRLTDGATKGLAEQTRGLGALDMQGKLAYKLQTLGDKRLNDMGVEELAAFESYAGISGSQLEQLMRVESQLMADYELAKKNDKTMTMSFQDFVSSNDDAQKQLEDVKDIEQSAEYYARKNVENTRSVFATLKNNIAIILNDIYSILSDWFGWSKDKADPESTSKVTDALGKLQLKTQESAERLGDLDAQLEAVDKTIQTTGVDSDAHQKALAEKALLQDTVNQEKLALAMTKQQASAIALMGSDKVKQSKDSDALIAKTASDLLASGKSMEAAQKFLSPEAFAQLQASVNAVAPVTKEVLREDFDEGVRYRTNGVKRAPTEVDRAATEQARAGALEAVLSGAVTLDDASAAALISTKDTSMESFRLSESSMRRDKKWQSSLFKDKSEEAHLDALKAYEGWKLGTYAGLSGDDLETAIAEWASGDTAMGKGTLADALVGKGYDFGSNMSGGTSKPARDFSPVTGGDFVMRPGQSAQRFNPSDTILGMKGGGPLVSGQGGGGVVNLTINGGDQAAVYHTVKSALKTAGMKGM